MNKYLCVLWGNNPRGWHGLPQMLVEQRISEDRIQEVSMAGLFAGCMVGATITLIIISLLQAAREEE